MSGPSPAAAVGTLVVGESSVRFDVGHRGRRPVTGTVQVVDGSITQGAALASTRVEATVRLDSLDTGDPKRDRRLRRLPLARSGLAGFRSVIVTLGRESDYVLSGMLTLDGQVKPLVFEVNRTGPNAFRAEARLSRDMFGLRLPIPRVVERFLVDDIVTISVTAVFDREVVEEGSVVVGDAPFVVD